MRVKEMMTKDVKTCRPDDSLNTAAGLLWDHDCGSLPVVDESSKVVGMVTDRDICMAAYTQGKPLRDIPVQSCMSRTVRACSPSDSLQNAEKLMQAHKVRRLPVVDGEGRIAGIISLHDIAREVLRQRSQMSRDVTNDEVGLTLAKICEREPRRDAPARTTKPVLAGEAQPARPILQ